MKTALLAATCLLLLSSAPAPAASECEGTCEDGAGSARTVSAGICRGDELCDAGCDTSQPGAARPFAQCISQATGHGRAPQAIGDPGGRREHD